MITVEDKLNKFSKIIIEKEQLKSYEKLDEVKRKNEEVIKEHKEKMKNKASLVIEKRISEGIFEKNEIISKVNIETKHKMLKKKNELMNKLVHEIINKSKNFTNSDRYLKYLTTNILDAINILKSEDIITIYLKNEDIKTFKKDIENLISKNNKIINKINISPTDEDIIGGLIAINENKTIRIDLSIRTKINDNKDFIGNTLYKALEKPGDIDG